MTMIVWKETEDGVRYYAGTSGGRAILGAKSSACEMDGDVLQMVCRHLRIMEPIAAIGRMHKGEKFSEEVKRQTRLPA